MLYVEPISEEIFEAAARVAASGRKIGFACSAEHVGPENYTGYTDREFMIERRRIYKEYNVWLHAERSPISPSQIQRIEGDIEHGFDAIHLFSHEFEEVEHTVLQFPKTTFQVGPGADTSHVVSPSLLDFASRTKNIKWVSYPMGLQVDGLRNVNDFAPPHTPEGYKLRAHECDYLLPSMRRRVSAFCPGMNIGPQLGAIQSSLYLHAIVVDGEYEREWLDVCCEKCTGIDTALAPLLYGHYHFDKLKNRRRESVIETLFAILQCWCKAI